MVLNSNFGDEMYYDSDLAGSTKGEMKVKVMQSAIYICCIHIEQPLNVYQSHNKKPFMKINKEQKC